MQKPRVYKLNEVNTKNFSFMSPQVRDKDIHVPIVYKDNGKKFYLFIQVPSLLLNDDYNGKELNIPLMGKTPETTKVVTNFFTQLDTFFYSKLEEIFKKLIVSHKNMLQSIKKVSYRKMVADTGDKSEVYKNGVLRYKMADNPEYTTKVFDDSCKLIDKSNYTSVFVKGSYVKSIIEISELLIRGSDVKVMYRVHQLRVNNSKPEKVTLDEYSFVESDSEAENNNDEKLDIKYDMKDGIYTQTDYLESERPRQTFVQPQLTKNKKTNFEEMTHLSATSDARDSVLNKEKKNTQVKESNKPEPVKQSHLQSEKMNNMTDAKDSDDDIEDLGNINSSSDTEDESVNDFIRSISQKR